MGNPTTIPYSAEAVDILVEIERGHIEVWEVFPIPGKRVCFFCERLFPYEAILDQLEQPPCFVLTAARESAAPATKAAAALILMGQS